MPNANWKLKVLVGRERGPLWGGELSLPGVLQGSAWAWLTWVSAKYLLPSGQTDAKTSQSHRGNLPSAAVSSGSSSSLNLAAERLNHSPSKQVFRGKKQQEGISGELQAPTFQRKPLQRPLCKADSNTQPQRGAWRKTGGEGGEGGGGWTHGDVLHSVPKEPAPAARVPLWSHP